MKYQSELIKEIIDSRGHEKSSLHYESECVESWIEEVKGGYPKLCDYQSEWLNYINENSGIGEFPYLALIDVTDAVVDNVVPYDYNSAILTGSTKYRDIDTGEVLGGFEEGRNLELVSVKMPVLTTTGKNLWNENDWSKGLTSSTGVVQTGGTYDGFRYNNELISVNGHDKIYCRTFAELDGVSGYNYRVAEYDSSKTFLRIILRNSQSHTVSNDCEYIRVHFDLRYNPNQSAPTDDIPTYGVVATEPITTYEPYKSNILTVNEPIELRGIGDVQDELDCLTGELTERIGEIVLNGNENWLQDAKNDTYTSFLLRRTGGKINCFCVCDKLPQKNTPMYTLNSEGVVTGGMVGDLLIIIKKERLNTDSVSGFKEWLSQNNLTVQYQLATESIKTVDLTATDHDGNTLSIIRPIEGTMHLMTEGIPIKPLFSGEIPVEAITQNLSSFIGLEME